MTCGGATTAIPNGYPSPVWLIVIPWDPSFAGGVGRVVLELAGGLKQQGSFKPIIFVQEWACRRPRMTIRDGIAHIFLRLREPDNAPRNSLKRTLRRPLIWWERWQLRRLLVRLNVRVLNFHYPTLAANELIAAGYALGSERLPAIFSIHGLDVGQAIRQNSAFAQRYFGMLSSGNAIVAVSNDLASKVRARLSPESAGKIVVVNNWVVPEKLLNHERWEMPLPRRYILNVATFEEKKGQKFLLDAFSRISSSYPELSLVLAGRDNGSLSGLRQKIAELGLVNRVTVFTDVPHSKIGALFASASLFCLSSLSEPFGIVLLEAGVFRLPVIATSVGGVPEVIRDGKDGILIGSGDSTQLANAISAMLVSPERATAMGASLHSRVITTFGWQAAIASYIDLVSTG